MAVITWDDTGKRNYETGTRNTVLYPKSSAGTYPMGVAWNGVSAITESPSGAESNPIYADDIKYIDLRSAEEFGGTIEAYTYPDEFMECDGSVEIVSGVKVAQQTRKSFGLSYKTVKGDDVDFNDAGDLLHLIYNATASPSERSYQSINDSPEAITFSWEFTTTPVDIGTYTINGVSRDIKKSALLTIDTKKVLAGTDGTTRLALLEKYLYGTATTDPQLPDPATVIGILNGTITAEPTSNGETNGGTNGETNGGTTGG